MLGFAFLTCSVISFSQKINTPHLDIRNGKTQLIVNGKPFLILGGELGNSTASSRENMQPVWAKLKSMSLNTVVMPVYWELIEPEENKFDFSLVDGLINDAASQNLHLVLLWFGTWKNSMSCYVPGWMKTNTQRFPRITNRQGRSVEIISAFSKDALATDCKAFAAFMKHIKEKDADHQTVIMVQVENEIGIIGNEKETSAAALAEFNQPVPDKLMEYLAKNRNKIDTALKKSWREGGYKTEGNWQQVFGSNTLTDEVFQAYHFAKYTNAVAAAGKAEYDIPMYVNAALISPTSYRSGGPVPPVLDIWKMAAPNIDLLSPDFYNPDTKYWCDLYAREDNTLFIPEIRFDSSDAAKAFFTIGHYHSLGFSPFAIESGSDDNNIVLQKTYHILEQMTPAITQTTPQQMDGVFLDKKHKRDSLMFGKYRLSVSHDNVLPWNGHSGDSVWNATGAIIIQTAPDEFLVGGTGMFINFSCKDTALNAGILSIDKGEFRNEEWKPLLRLNGDEDHQGRHLRIELGKWDIQRIKLYQYK